MFKKKVRAAGRRRSEEPGLSRVGGVPAAPGRRLEGRGLGGPRRIRLP